MVEDGWTDGNGQMPQHEYIISSPCELDGLGELKRIENKIIGI